MANNIPAVARFVKEYRAGFPNGTTEVYRAVPTLLARIDELERALDPFARVAVAESSVPAFHAKDIVNVRRVDCVKALEMLDDTQGYQQPADNFFNFPA